MTLNYGGPSQITEEDALLGVASVCEKSDYWCYGKETAPTTGQKHLQCYFQLTKKARMETIKKWHNFLRTCHLEPARGDEVQNKEYCKKEGAFAESETEPRKINAGRRESDRWTETAELAKRGRFMETDPQMQVLHLTHMQRLYNHCKPNPEALTHTWRAEWFYGPPGTGKSLTARREIATVKPGGVYMKLLNKWWDNFQEDQGVIMEDVDHETAKHLGNHIKVWCDIYPFTSEFKGGAGPLRPDVMYITSNYHPYQLFGHDELLFKAILRRVNLRYFPKNGESPPDYPGLDSASNPGETMQFVTPPPSLTRGLMGSKTPEPEGRPHFPLTIDVSEDADPSSDSEEEESSEEED